MKKLLTIVAIAGVMGCADVKDKADISKYRGCILIDRSTDWRGENPAGSYIHTFRKGDSIWSESYMYGVFAQFQKGDTIK